MDNSEGSNSSHGQNSNSITSAPPTRSKSNLKVWWSNASFFVGIHLAYAIGAYYYRPYYAVPRSTLVLAVLLWQVGCLGVTIGYHRLWSHRAFRAGVGVRVVLAALGSSAFQGSIKWWCLRHRLHHRYTDDPVHDPYAATRGLLYSHMGWIFFKPTYERMELVDREDLDSDPVVTFQHRYFVPLALLCGIVLPTAVGSLWNDALGAFIWAALGSRLLIWHCTFFVNSLAHWEGLQPWSDENTSRGNLILALLTSGEGNHNFHHAFPHDYRAGPSKLDWDPSKWIISVLHRFGLTTNLRRAREVDMKEAQAYMDHKAHGVDLDSENQEDSYGELWGAEKVQEYAREKPGRCIIIIGNNVVDATRYLAEHPGGSALLRNYSIRVQTGGSVKWRDASWAFDGGLNNHSRAAKKRMHELTVANIRT